jgi:hypothetical protein
VKLDALLSPQTLELLYSLLSKIAYHRDCFLMLELDDHRRRGHLLLTFCESFDFPLFKMTSRSRGLISSQFNSVFELGRVKLMKLAKLGMMLCRDSADQ